MQTLRKSNFMGGVERVVCSGVKLFNIGELRENTYEYENNIGGENIYVLVNYNHFNNYLEIQQVHNESSIRGLTKSIISSFDELLGVLSVKFSNVVEDKTVSSLENLLDNFDVVGDFCLIGRDEEFKSPFLNCVYDLGFDRINFVKMPNRRTYTLNAYRN